MDLYDENEELSTRRRPRHAGRIPDDVAEGILRRMATVGVWRKTNQHDCPQRDCTHLNHRRDAEYTREMLDMLGLDRTGASYTEAEQRTLLKWIGQAPPEEQAA